MEVFESGNKTIESFDKIESRQKMQEALQGLYSKQICTKLTSEENASLQMSVNGPFGQAPTKSTAQLSSLNKNVVSWQMPNQTVQQPQLTATQRMRQNLMMNAGIVQRDTDKRRVSAQVYTTESTKFIKKQLAEVESNFHQI